MKAKHLLPIAALALPLVMQAKPAWPGLHKVVNPDGTTVEYRVHGDEHFSYFTDADGMLMKRDMRGAMVYDLIDGAKIKVTNEVIENMLQANHDSNGAFHAAPSRMAGLDVDGRTTYPTIGSSKSLIVLVEYSDVKFQPTSPQDIKDMLTKEGYNKFGSFGSAYDYYKTNSGGKYTPIFDVSRVVTLPETSEYYAYDPNIGGGKYDRWSEALRYALNELDDEIDFSQYDCDGDGKIDTIYFFYAGYGQADTPTDNKTIWPHQSDMSRFRLYYDGVLFGPYACSNELNGQSHYYNQDYYVDGPGTFVHEFGHVLGMPDLYSPYYAGTETTPGYWDVMDGGTYNNDGYCPPALSAYEKWVYKWLEYTMVEDNTSYTLNHIEDGGAAIRVPVLRKSGSAYDSEYFILESRTKDGWDTYLDDSGLLIWHIQYDASAWAQNSVNTIAGHPRVYILSADGTANPHNGGKGSPRLACWPGTDVNNTFISPETEIAFVPYATNVQSNPLNVYLTSIAYDKETATSSFDYNVVTEKPAITCDLYTPYRTSTMTGAPTSGFVLEWGDAYYAEGDNNPEIDQSKVEYLVTIYRYTSSGKKIYESNYNEKNVGKVKSVTVKNLTNTKMGFEYHAYVRPVYSLPSSLTSKEKVFVTNKLSTTSGIESVGADVENAAVYGVKGSVVAPRGAEIYNLSGIRVANDGLAPGVYIVRVGSKVQKVTVR